MYGSYKSKFRFEYKIAVLWKMSNIMITFVANKPCKKEVVLFIFICNPHTFNNK